VAIENFFPFTYPPRPHIRRHGPRGYSSFESYPPWLRDEFFFRCVYCLARETWWRLSRSFEIDHRQPKSQSNSMSGKYGNLLYVCNVCNASKGSQILVDPTEVMVAQQVAVLEDGSIRAVTPQSQEIVYALKLDSLENCEFRRLMIGISALAWREDKSLYLDLMGYPSNLPDLSMLRPPAGNDRPEGVMESCFARRQRGTLPGILY
jgi:hypothetical protein